MIQRLRFLTAFAALLIAAATAPRPADATTVQRVVSPGGIEAWLVQEPSLPLVALNFAFIGGATQDPTDKPGVGYMVSSLLDDGAGDLDAKAFQRKLEDNAVELRFSVTQDYFTGSIRLLKDRLEPSFDLLRLALNEPRFDADAIGRVREQIMAGLRRETTDPGSIANRAWWRTAFPGHPYGRPTGGTQASIPTVTADDLRTFSRQVFTRETLKIAKRMSRVALSCLQWNKRALRETFEIMGQRAALHYGIEAAAIMDAQSSPEYDRFDEIRILAHDAGAAHAHHRLRHVELHHNPAAAVAHRYVGHGDAGAGRRQRAEHAINYLAQRYRVDIADRGDLQGLAGEHLL